MMTERKFLMVKGKQMRNRMLTCSLGLMLVTALAGQAVFAQEPSNSELKKQIQALSDTVKAMQTDLQDIKALLQRGAQPASPPQNVVLDLGTNLARGAKNAPLTMVEFTDYQCPFCSRYLRDTYPQIEKDYIATGKLKYVMLDMPLESIHKFAFKAAEAANCAGEQGKYWEMHDRLFSNQQTIDSWDAHAEAVGLDLARFQACLASGHQEIEIRRDMAQGQSAGVTGTPGFFLAMTDPASNKVKTLRSIKGAQPYPAFKAQIDALLEEQAAGGKKNP
jgi:protein-disulfide isomerase